MLTTLPSSPTVNGETRVIVLMAWPAAHVRTPTLFNAHCARKNINAIMVPWAVRPEHLTQAWDGLRHVANLAGVVLTIPHKQAAAELCEELDGDASLLGVVNAVRRNASGSYTGRMYDGSGFVAGMLREGIALAGKRVLLLGAGGAATALALALAREGIARLTIANRSREKARDLAALVGKAVPNCEVKAGSDEPGNHDIVINATSLGLKPDDVLPCDTSKLTPEMVVAEVVMQPAVTRFLVEAEARGARTHRGEHMVTSQLDHFVEFLLTNVNPQG
ncbi:shikimate dehydrogenase [Burkholderia sp. BCC1993]|uniref:shikimate dehydrogenase family protein n=1 Tax=Burkholderia sp. BCC1993 TaxID=2817444 RepID=UPI002AB323C6|nr:shikimate dehydrogenase [Burkholderia sp. BCC1993]